MLCIECGHDIPKANRKRVTKYCSRDCWAKVQRRRAKTTTYRKRNGRHEHRVVMEQKLGRRLRRNEVVHHIDGDSWNNDPSNLELTTQSKHASHHFSGVKHSAEHVRKRMLSKKRTLARKK
jgi:hypothetical protein